MSDIIQQIRNPKRQILINNLATRRVGRRQWDIISKSKIEDFELWTILYDCGKKYQNNSYENCNTVKDFIYCGDEIYIDHIHKELEKNNIITNTTTNNIPQKTKINKNIRHKQPNKAQIIKQQNFIKKIKSEMHQIISTINMDNNDSYKYVTNINLNSKYAEITFVKMIIHCKNMCRIYDNELTKLKSLNKTKYTEEADIINQHIIIKSAKSNIYNFLIAVTKIMKEYDLYKIPSECKKIFSDCINYAKKITNFNTQEIIKNYPEFLFRTKYDIMLKFREIKLYPSQQELLNYVIASQNESYLALMHTMLGSGKTTMILPLCGWLSTQKNKSKILYCCPNNVVIIEVAQMLYAMAVAFCIVIHNPDTTELEYKWSNFTNKNDPHKSCIIYLCDMIIAKNLLQKRYDIIKHNKKYESDINFKVQSVPDYIFIGDELTKDADNQNGYLINTGFSITTELFVEIMRIIPPKTILMSATLPSKNELPDFYGAIVSNNPGMNIISFSAAEAKIGCCLIASSGNIYLPHSNCKNIYDINRIIDTIKTNPFIGRFYTFDVLVNMHQYFFSQNVDVPDISILVEDPTSATQTKIQEISITMLKSLEKYDSAKISEICGSNNMKCDSIRIDKIFTQDIHKFSKGCLIFSSDPITSALKTYRDNFKDLTDSTSDRNIFQQIKIDNLISKYKQECEIWRKNYQRMEKSKKNNNNQDKKDRDESTGIDSWQILSNMLDQKPKWNFPQILKLYTTEHLKYSLENFDNICNMECNGFVEPENLPEISTVSHEILTLLASGIGIYSTKTNLLDDEYLDIVLSLTKQGIIKFLFTDSSIAYGTNLAVSDIIIIDEDINISTGEIKQSIATQHSMKTLFQMMGRAGRGGNLSFKANIYTTSPNNELIKYMNDYIMNSDTIYDCRNEINNIHNAYNILW